MRKKSAEPGARWHAPQPSQLRSEPRIPAVETATRRILTAAREQNQSQGELRYFAD